MAGAALCPGQLTWCTLGAVMDNSLPVSANTHPPLCIPTLFSTCIEYVAQNSDVFQGVDASWHVSGPVVVAGDGAGYIYTARDTAAVRWTQTFSGFSQNIQAVGCVGKTGVWLSQYNLGDGAVAMQVSPLISITPGIFRCALKHTILLKIHCSVQVSTDSGRSFKRIDLTNTAVVPIKVRAYSILNID